MFESSPTDRSTRIDEHGAVMVIVTVIVIIVGILTVAISMGIIDSSKRSATRGDRVRLTTVLEDAARAYQRGLRSGIISERTDYVLDRAAAGRLVAADEDSVALLDDDDASIPAEYLSVDGLHRLGSNNVVTAPPSFTDSGVPGEDLTFVIRTKVSDDRYTFWQVERVDAPSPYASGDRLAIYFQAWEANIDGTQATRDRIHRVEYNVGRFSDFQLLTNSTVLFGAGTTINGSVHSNATSSSAGVDLPPGVSIGADDGSVTCSGSPLITSTSGGISLPGCAGSATIAEGTGSVVDFSAAGDAVENIANDCGISAGDSIACLDSVPGGRIVLVQHGRVNTYGNMTPTQFVDQWKSAGALPTPVQSWPLSRTKPVVLLVDGDVRFWPLETITGRLTIATRSTGAKAAGDVTIKFNLSVVDPLQDVVGLMAHGNILIDSKILIEGSDGPWIDVSCKVNTINAAMIARTGGVQLPTHYLTDVPFPGAVESQCDTGSPDLSIVGSMATHHAPIFRVKWSTGDWSGFDKRTYEWNPALRENPPPYFPVTEKWEISNAKEANDDCLVAPRRTDWDCR